MQKFRVLLIEDNLSDHIHVMKLLNEFEVEVESAVNFERARELIKNKNYDFIIAELLLSHESDLHWDGIQFWNYSQTVRPNSTVLLLAEESMRLATEELMDGMTQPPMISKPACHVALRTFVQQCLLLAKKVAA